MALADLTHFSEDELLKNHGLDQLLNISCVRCSKRAKIQCLTCYGAWYCSEEHQKSDLETHQFSCSSPLKLQNSNVFGRHYVASRDLEAGAIVLDEEQAFGGPRADKNDNSTVYCLSCCLRIGFYDYHRCSKCLWPMCGVECEQSPIHANYECKFLADNKVKFPTQYDNHVTYKGIFNIRGLFLKETDPAVWEEVKKLEHVLPKLGNISLWPNLQMYKKLFGIPQDFGELEEWNKIQGICNVNSFYDKQDGKCGNFVFTKASMFAQSCAPNASWSIIFGTNKIKPRIVIRTTTKVCNGEIVGILYAPSFITLGTEQRQNAGFICKCSRCIDPEELATFYSAMKCTVTGCTGFTLPENPPAENLNTSIWKCNKEGCPYTINGDKLLNTVEMMDARLKQLPLTAIDKYIRNELDKVLHPNHWLLLKALSRIVLETDINEVNDLDGEELDQYICYCRRILKVYDVISPGLNIKRGLILRAMGPPVLRQLDAKFNMENLSDTLREALQAYDLLKEAFLCLKDYPSPVPTPPAKYDLRSYSILVVMNAAKEFIDTLQTIISKK